MAKLSEEAQYWLQYFRQNPTTRINYTTLMAMKVSRRKSMAIIKELKTAGSLKVITRIAGGSKLVLTELTTVVSSGNAIKRYNHSASTAIVPIAVQLEMNNIATKFPNEVWKEDEGSMSWGGIFEPTSSNDDEITAEKRKWDNYKKLSYQKKSEQAQADQKLHRDRKDPITWTCKDVVSEFSSRLGDFWDVAPVTVTHGQFTQALGTFRKKHDTNGAIELELINLFFANFRSEKITDGNHAWRAFLYKAPQLLPTARERVITPEQIETAIIDDTARAQRKLSLLDEDDDV